VRAIAICLILCASSLSGCLEDERVKLPPPEEPSLPDGTFVTGPDGLEIEGEPLPMNFVFSDVGEEGAEPSIGVTSSGCIFFIAFEKPMRSCDHGETWVDTSDITQAFFTNDPYRYYRIRIEVGVSYDSVWVCSRKSIVFPIYPK